MRIPINAESLGISDKGWTDRQLTEYDLRAIYEYRSSIPCLEGTAAGRKNECV
jgi:hypothetical protein